jgi:4-hydroxybenzoyl-CoA thioesterase
MSITGPLHPITSHATTAGYLHPRYFDLIHEAKDWFGGLDWPFASMIGEMRNGFPIVRLEADFRGPSRIGDELTIALWVPVLGGASMHLHYAVTCNGAPRLDARTVIVHVNLDTGRPLPIGEALRARIEGFRGEGASAGAASAAGR